MTAREPWAQQSETDVEDAGTPGHGGWCGSAEPCTVEPSRRIGGAPPFWMAIVNRRVNRSNRGGSGHGVLFALTLIVTSLGLVVPPTPTHAIVPDQRSGDAAVPTHALKAGSEGEAPAGPGSEGASDPKHDPAGAAGREEPYATMVRTPPYDVGRACYHILLNDPLPFGGDLYWDKGCYYDPIEEGGYGQLPPGLGVPLAKAARNGVLGMGGWWGPHSSFWVQYLTLKEAASAVRYTAPANGTLTASTNVLGVGIRSRVCLSIRTFAGEHPPFHSREGEVGRACGSGSMTVTSESLAAGTEVVIFAMGSVDYGTRATDPGAWTGYVDNITYTFEPEPPPNDAFADAIPIGVPSSTTGDNLGATVEDGEPLPSCIAAGATVWYALTIPEDKLLRLDTTNSGFDTVVAVYDGDSLEGLSEIACSDDTVTGIVRTSILTFEAAAGETYYVQLAGWEDRDGNDQRGMFELTIDEVK